MNSFQYYTCLSPQEKEVYQFLQEGMTIRDYSYIDTSNEHFPKASYALDMDDPRYFPTQPQMESTMRSLYRQALMPVVATRFDSLEEYIPSFQKLLFMHDIEDTDDYYICKFLLFVSKIQRSQSVLFQTTCGRYGILTLDANILKYQLVEEGHLKDFCGDVKDAHMHLQMWKGARDEMAKNTDSIDVHSMGQ